MKKLLTYNSLDKCYSNHQIKGDIALHSIFIELLSSVLSLTEEAMITYQQKIFIGFNYDGGRLYLLSG